MANASSAAGPTVDALREELGALLNPLRAYKPKRDALTLDSIFKHCLTEAIGRC
jgi:hypothetical protein